MKASELIQLLQSAMEREGDLGVLVSAFTGFGYEASEAIEIVSVVETQDSAICGFCDASDASRMGRDPASQKRFIHVR